VEPFLVKNAIRVFIILLTADWNSFWPLAAVVELILGTRLCTTDPTGAPSTYDLHAVSRKYARFRKCPATKSSKGCTTRKVKIHEIHYDLDSFQPPHTSHSGV